MAAVDFTTFTEVDPNSDLTVTSNTVTMDVVESDLTVGVHKDYGAGNFADFVHEIEWDITRSDQSSIVVPWGVHAGTGIENNDDTTGLTIIVLSA